jgi:hypothetical protein
MDAEDRRKREDRMSDKKAGTELGQIKRTETELRQTAGQMTEKDREYH